MPFKIVLEPRARFDLQEAINYYDSKQIGLGLSFINDFERHLFLVSENPFFAIIYKDYRALTIKQFPYYQIIYHINETTKTVYIDAIFHASQNPDKKP